MGETSERPHLGAAGLSFQGALGLQEIAHCGCPPGRCGARPPGTCCARPQRLARRAAPLQMCPPSASASTGVWTSDQAIETQSQSRRPVAAASGVGDIAHS
ncbi:unnamed protein product [Prorocentrum cordatum]|uniref:Uncharacterized protein n=1 Tax=Prorocentrum cordatum TaxID=2364126 RepID=A0ABN9WPA9_9DINO|nr:unnamed protein product [Polarella glacialis]